MGATSFRRKTGAALPTMMSGRASDEGDASFDSRGARAAPTLLCLAPVHDAGPRRLEWRAFVAAWAKMAGRCVEEEEAARIRGSRDQDRARSRSPIRRRPSRGRSRSLSPGPRSREDSARAATARGVFLVDGGGGDEGAIATALADVAPSLGDSVEAAATRCVTRVGAAARVRDRHRRHLPYKKTRGATIDTAPGGGSRGAFEEDREVSGEWGDATGRRGIARTTRCCRREMCCVNVSSTRRGLPPPGGSPRARRILLRARRRLRVRRTCSPSRRPRFPRRRRGRASRRRRARRRAPRT